MSTDRTVVVFSLSFPESQGLGLKLPQGRECAPDFPFVCYPVSIVPQWGEDTVRGYGNNSGWEDLSLHSVPSQL